MLIAVGTVAVVEGVLIYKQSNVISELQAKNAKISKEFDAKLQKITRENQEHINKLIKERNIEKKERKELIVKNQELINVNQELIQKVSAILELPGIKAVVQNCQEAGDMYQSNYSEVTVAEEENCGSPESDDIEIIDQPDTDMNELVLSSNHQVISK